MIVHEDIFRTSETAYAVDRYGQIVVWNRAAERTFGYTESEALGQQCWKLLSGRDVFGNRSCCEGCPIRTTAFNNEPISRFQIDFKTATHERKRFNVSTLMFFNRPGKEVFVHLCSSESGADNNPATKTLPNQSAANSPYKALTPRETEVLTHLNRGMTIRKIASTLGISVSTISNHTQHILLKLRVHSRFEAVALGRKLNLI